MLFALGLVDAGFERGGSAIDHFLRLLEAETEQGFHLLHDLQLAATGRFQYYVELGLLGLRGCAGLTTSSTSYRYRGGCGLDTVFVFQDLQELGNVLDGKFYELVGNCFDVCHNKRVFNSDTIEYRVSAWKPKLMKGVVCQYFSSLDSQR